MRFNFLKLLDSCIFYPAAVHDNVVSNDVTITSALPYVVL